MVELHGRIHGRVKAPALNARHLRQLGACYRRLGECRRAIDLHSQALTIDREIGDRWGEGADLSHLGLCYLRRGECRRPTTCTASR